MPDFYDVLKSRRSIRAYTDQAVSDADLQELVELAILAPSAMNFQPWNFIVVTNRQVIADVNTRVKEILHEQNVAETFQMEALQAALKSPEFSIFYHAPALIVLTAVKDNPMAALDCQLAAENLFLAAQANGLGTCYMGFLFFGQDDDTVRQLLHIPENHNIMAACCVGYPKVIPPGQPVRNAPQIEWVR